MGGSHGGGLPCGLHVVGLAGARRPPHGQPDRSLRADHTGGDLAAAARRSGALRAAHGTFGAAPAGEAGRAAPLAREADRTGHGECGVNGRLHVFVLVDALGWRWLEGRAFLDDLLPHRQPLRTVLGYSSGAIPTLLTGRPPSEHGHWNLFYYDPAGSPFRWLRRLDFLPAAALDNRVTRR